MSAVFLSLADAVFSPQPIEEFGEERDGRPDSACTGVFRAHANLNREDYEIRDGRVVRSRKPLATRGLNRNCNRRLKEVFISAATRGSQTEPYRRYVEGLHKTGMRAEMARPTLARKIAAIALRIWKKGETFDPKKLNWAT